MSFYPKIAKLLCEPKPRFEIWIGTAYCKFHISKNMIYGGHQLCATGYTCDWNQFEERTSGGGYCKVSSLIADFFAANCRAFNKSATLTMEQISMKSMLESDGESSLNRIFGRSDSVYRFADFQDMMDKFKKDFAPRLALRGRLG